MDQVLSSKASPTKTIACPRQCRHGVDKVYNQSAQTVSNGGLGILSSEEVQQCFLVRSSNTRRKR
jgi:hypothetical protein